MQVVTVLIENTAGTLAAVTGALAEAGINVYGLSADIDRVHFLLRDPGAARTLQSKGFDASMDTVLSVRMEHKPGQAHELATRLAEADINIQYAFGSGSALYLSTDDDRRAAAIIGSIFPGQIASDVHLHRI